MVMDREMKKKNNRGMSLVEIIIVIALMSVIAGVTGYGLSLISNKPVEECARKVEMILNRNRTNSMGKKDAWVEFYTNSEGLVTYEEHLESGGGAPEQVTGPVVIGDKDVALRIYYSDGSSVVLGKTDTDHIHWKVAFSRDSGAVKEKDGKKCTKIEVYKGEGYKKVIKLEQLTGKVTVE